MQQSPTLSKTNGDGVATEEKMVFGRNTIPRQYMELVHEKFAKQKQKVKENVAKLRTHIRNISIESEEGQLEVFRANKAMKAELEYYQTLHKRQENSLNLTREYMSAESIVEKEIFEDAMRLEIEAMTMMKQQQKHDAHHQSSSGITTNNKSTTTTTPPSTATTIIIKKKKNKSKSLFRKARSQLTLTHLQRSHLTLKKQQRKETTQEQQDSDTTASTHSNSSTSYFRPEDDNAPSPSPPAPAPMMKRSVSFSKYSNVKRVPSVLDLLGGQCKASNAAAKDNIWYDKTDFCGFAQKEMSRRSHLGITSTSALHSNVGRSDDCDSDIGDDADINADADDHSNGSDSDESRRSHDNNKCDYLRNRTNPNRMMNRTNNSPHRIQ